MYNPLADQNKEIMLDTLRRCRGEEALAQAIIETNRKQYILTEEELEKMNYSSETWSQNIIVSEGKSFETAKKYLGKKIAVLDFANYYSAGGAPFSARAQEESMCRISTLYPCINTIYNYDHYYLKHRNESNNGIIDNYGGADLIYVPDVVVFKTDSQAPQVMEKKDWYKTDVIVAAAPHLWWKEKCSEEKYLPVMRRLVRGILNVAAKEKVEVLILGAIGCGAFNNPPELVAKIFKEELKHFSFDTVEFAIHRGHHENHNYEAFQDIFSGRGTNLFDMD